MIKKIILQIWNERRSNAWLWVELFLVSVVLWFIVDWLYVMATRFYEPLGFDITNTYRLLIEEIPSGSTSYITWEEKGTSSGEDLLILRERLSRHPDIEFISISRNSSPYNNNSDGIVVKYDTLGMVPQIRRVHPEFFNVFRYENANPNDKRPLSELLREGTVIAGPGLFAYYGITDDDLRAGGIAIGSTTTHATDVVAVTKPVKLSETYPGRYGNLFIANYFGDNEIAEFKNPSALEVCVRLKPGREKNFPERLMEEADRQYRSGNLFISDVIPFSETRRLFNLETVNEVKSYLIVMGFFLINIFLGVIGTFWLRTEARRSQIGLRMALGSSGRNIRSWLLIEGLLILMLATIPAWIVDFNLAYAELNNPLYGSFLSAGRFVICTLVSLLLMVVMIIAGVLFPSYQAMNTRPAEALHED